MNPGTEEDMEPRVGDKGYFGRKRGEKTYGEVTKPKRPDAEVLRDLQYIEGALSPENLHCDGEISASAARRKGAALRRRQRELVRELGRTPTSQELYGY